MDGQFQGYSLGTVALSHLRFYEHQSHEEGNNLKAVGDKLSSEIIITKGFKISCN